MGKDLSIYGHSNIFDHELFLLTIIYMISKLGGETLSAYLSLCSIDAICSKNMLWVVEIMEDYMIVEYVEFAKSKLWHRPFLKIRWIVIVWWLRMKFASLWSMLSTCELFVTCSWEVLWDELLLWHIIMLEKLIEIIFDQTCAPASIHTS